MTALRRNLLLRLYVWQAVSYTHLDVYKRQVDVVGVIPSVHTSAGLPVLRQTSDSSASGLSGLPVITINFNPGFRLCASCVNSTISRVLPELEMSNSKSFSCKIPRSPCCASPVSYTHLLQLLPFSSHRLFMLTRECGYWGT